MIFTFLMAGRIDSFSSLAPFLLLPLALSALYFFLSANKLPSFIFTLLTLAAGLLVATGGLGFIDEKSIEKRWKATAPGLELLESTDSPYQHIAVGKLAEQYSIYADGEIITSFPDPHTFMLEAHLAACQHPDPKSVLVIGAGAEGMVRYLQHSGIEWIDYLETDNKLIQTVYKYLPEVDKAALAAPGVRRIARDGRVFVRNSGPSYDLIIINMPDPSTALVNRFYTRDFFQDLNGALKPGGVATFSMTSAVNYLGEEVGDYIGSVYKSLSSFSHVLILPGDTARFYISNDPDSVSDDWLVLQKRYRERGAPEDEFSTLMFKMHMNRDRIDHFKKGMEKYAGARTNTDANPVTYYYNLILWDQFSKGQASDLLRFWEGIGPWKVILITVIAGLIIPLILFLQRRRGYTSNRLGAGWIIFSTGFAGMGLEITLLLAYQNAHGALYERIGLLVALFMLGLACGGGSMTLIIGKTDTFKKSLVISEAASMAVILLISVAVMHYLPEGAYYMAVLLTGSVVGAQFPLAAASISDGKSVGKVAGLIDWADHLGAFFGAVFTGIMLIPIFGLAFTCLFIAALKSTSFVTAIIKK